MTVKEILLTEIKKRKELYQQEIDEYKKQIEKDKIETESLKSYKQEIEKELSELEEKFKEYNKIKSYDYVIELEDKSIELCKKEDVEIVTDFPTIIKCLDV
jgi:predicted nuclease with TOPRIM domain